MNKPGIKTTELGMGVVAGVGPILIGALRLVPEDQIGTCIIAGTVIAGLYIAGRAAGKIAEIWARAK